MAFGDLSMAKTVAMNAPKPIRRIVEPFADRGTIAMFPGMKKPKDHLVNIEDEILFEIYLFIQTLSAGDKKRLKSFDWIGSPETFDAALAITATEGPELYYRFNYVKQFGKRSLDPEALPTFDFLRFGQDMSAILFTLPMTKFGLKKVTLLNEDPLAVMAGAGGGADTFMILAPGTPEQVEAVEAKLPVSASYFFAKKSKSLDELFESAASAGDKVVVSTFASSSIMMATMEVQTNYEHKSANKLTVVPAIEDLGGNASKSAHIATGGKSGHTLTEERLSQTPSHKPTQAQAHYVAILARQQPALVRMTERRLIAFFKKMGREVAAVALPILQETFKMSDGISSKATAEDSIIVERILIGASMLAAEAVLRETYETVYLEVARASGEAVEVLGLATGLPDPVARAVVQVGGRRAGLLDMTAKAKTSLFNALVEGREAGEGADALARRIRGNIARGPYGDVKTRARVVARTETAFAQSTSTIERARDAGVQMAIVFDNLTGFDDDICSGMNGIIVTLDEAQALAADEHPNGTRSFSPLIQEDQQEQ